jgi:hypothetical protein
MFRDMGYRDARQLRQMVRVSREYFASALANGGYHAVLAEIEGAGVVGGGGTKPCRRGPVNLDVPGDSGYRLSSTATH